MFDELNTKQHPIIQNRGQDAKKEKECVEQPLRPLKQENKSKQEVSIQQEIEIDPKYKHVQKIIQRKKQERKKNSGQAQLDVNSLLQGFEQHVKAYQHQENVSVSQVGKSQWTDEQKDEFLDDITADVQSYNQDDMSWMDQIDNPTDEQLKLIAQIKAIDAENKKNNNKKAKPKKSQYPKQEKQKVNPHLQKGFDKQIVQDIQQAIHPTKGKSEQEIISDQERQLFQLLGLEI